MIFDSSQFVVYFCAFKCTLSFNMWFSVGFVLRLDWLKELGGCQMISYC